MKTRKLFFKRILPLMMVAVMAFTSVPANIISRVTGSDVADMATVSAATDYGLADNIQDGTILHCFDWKYNDIKEELPNIAAAGFTSVQTSPAQRDDSFGVWYMLYQPQTFSIYTNALGSKQDLQALCEEAKKYGIKVVVDVVANHTRSIGDDGLGGDCYHNDGDAWYSDRYGITHGKIGMPDLNSESSTVQNKVKGYIEELKSVGVEGIRWDAAKHIGLPSENCQFWPVVTSVGLYNYGEILVGPLEEGGEGLMKEYTNYMSVTDSRYGATVREAFDRGGVPTSIGNWSERGVSKDKLVYWSESHDTYSNNGEYGEATQFIDQNKIDRAYAVVAAQGKATSLYFSRPNETDKHKIMAGAKGSTHFTSKEVAEVNHFHNAVIGEKEYYVGDTSQNVAAVCRESGAVIVKGSGSGQVSVKNGGGTTAPGTYTDQVSGSTWTVTADTISGTIGDKGIAVIYNKTEPVKTPMPTISKEGGNFSDTLTLTIGLKNATEGTYKIGDASAEKYTGSKQIIIGNDMSFGDSVTVTLTATDGSQTETKTYKFTKVEQTGNVVYLDLPSGWNKPVYCYAFTSVDENAEWPGEEMTLDTASGYYKYEIPEDLTTPEVILHDNKGNRTSPDMQPGKIIDGSWLYKDGSWSEYSSPRPQPQPDKGTVTVKYVDESGKEIAAAKTLTGNVGSSYETSAATVSGYTLKGTPSNAAGKYTKEAITVTYTYTKNGNDEKTPTVTSSLAEGSSFKTETAKITLTLQNAESGTYSVDDGPVRTFTGSAEVVIGQGKVADSTITVKATAKSGTETKDYTFTYKKQFDKTVDETVKALQANTAGSTLQANTAGNAFASNYYKTNPSGTGGEKTITSASDWTAADLIAQGAANDDSNIFKGPHEYPFYDSYALYGAYDDSNVYIGWQFVNTRDVSAQDQDGAKTNEARPDNADIPQMLVLDIGSAKGAYGDGTMDAGGTVWGIDVKYTTNVNAIMCFSSKVGEDGYPIGTPGLFTTKSDGTFSYDEEYCKTFRDIGIKLKYENGLFGGITNLYGINKNAYTGLTTNMLYSNDSEWVDFLTLGHSKTLDHFYTMTIPYSALGITKDDVKNNGIGVMHVSTYGASGVASIPMDDSMYDNAAEEYSSDGSTTKEKEDQDIITAPLARIGKAGSPNPNPTPTPDPVPDPDPTPDSLELNFGADRSSPQTATTALSLKGIAKGGTAPYTYKFYVNNKLVEEKSGSGEVSVNWTPAAGDNQIIKCQVTDSKGNTAQSAKFYTIEGKVDDCRHSNTTVQGKKDATCTETGYTGDTVCTDCSEVTAKGTVIPAKGHNWSSGVCTVCGAKQDDAAIDVTVLDTDIVYDGKAKTPQVIVKAGKELLTKDVDYTVSYKNNTNAGEALVVVTCKGNYTGTIEKTFTIAKATGPESGIPGTKKNVPKSTEKVSDIELPAGWKWLEEDAAKILETGVTVTATAVYEGADKNNFETVRVSVQITKGDCAHSYDKIKIKNDRAAGCTEPGYTGDKYCEDCGEIVENGTEIKAIGHLWGDGRVTKQPTASETGEMTYTCSRCTATKTEELPAVCKHMSLVVKNKKAATCTEKGYSGDSYCKVCGEVVEKGNDIPATGHSWDAGKVTKAPTATAKGVKTYTCTKCRNTRTEEIPATGGSSISQQPVITVPGNVEKGDAVNDPATEAVYTVTNKGLTTKTVKYVVSSSEEDTVVVPNSVVINGDVYIVTAVAGDAFKGNDKAKQIVVGDNVKTIGANAFSNCKNLSQVTLGKNVTSIGANAFSNCKKMSKVTIGKNVTSIGKNAFGGCTKLRSVTLPSKLSKIDEKAFYKCTNLKSITIPSKVKKIGKNAFNGCKNLKSITIKTTKLTKKSVGSNAFKGINSKATIKVPKKKLKSYKSLLKAKGVSSKAKIKK